MCTAQLRAFLSVDDAKWLSPSAMGRNGQVWRRNVDHARATIASAAAVGDVSISDMQASKQRKLCRIGLSPTLQKLKSQAGAFYLVNETGNMVQQLNCHQMGLLQGWSRNASDDILTHLTPRQYRAALGNGICRPVLLGLVQCLLESQGWIR